MLHASKASASCTFLHLSTFMQPCLGNEAWVERRQNKCISHLREAFKCERMEEALGVFWERKCSGNSFWILHQCHHTWKKTFLLVLCAFSSGCASLRRHLAEWASSGCLCRSCCAIQSEPLAQDQYWKPQQYGWLRWISCLEKSEGRVQQVICFVSKPYLFPVWKCIS